MRFTGFPATASATTSTTARVTQATPAMAVRATRRLSGRVTRSSRNAPTPMTSATPSETTRIVGARESRAPATWLSRSFSLASRTVGAIAASPAAIGTSTAKLRLRPGTKANSRISMIGVEKVAPRLSAMRATPASSVALPPISARSSQPSSRRPASTRAGQAGMRKRAAVALA